MQLGPRWLYLTPVFFFALSAAAFGQAIRAQMSGTITDESGSALPGVSVVLTSPALQVPQIQRIADATGAYQFVDLPAGTYRLAYELPGFATLVREEVRLSTGFAARMDIVMKVASVAETITVTGESPIIDVTNTRGGTIVSNQLLQDLPTNRNYQDLFIIVGGVQIVGPPLPGSGGHREINQNFIPKTYGMRLKTTNTFEGLAVESNITPDMASFDEVDVKSFGNTAEVANPSAYINMIIKSGGNKFHGRYMDKAQGSKTQSDNLDDALRRQGLTAGDSVVWENDLTADLGGRVVRDKLWFYVAVRDVRNARTIPGFVGGPGPDNRYLTGDEPIAYSHEYAPAQSYKISFQPTASHRFVSFWSRTPVVNWEQGASRFVPLESTVRHREMTTALKPVEWQWVVNNQATFNMFYGGSGLDVLRRLQTGSENKPATLDRETQLQTGGSFLTVLGKRLPQRPHQVAGRFDYYPLTPFLGTHAFQTGFRFQRGRFATEFPNLPYGDYQLIYDRVGGVSHQPVEISTQNRPVAGAVYQNLYAIYGSDTWRPSRRVTVNLGLRWDRNVNWVPEQTQRPGPFSLGGQYPRVDAGTFTNLAPRFGAAYDVFGNGTTVVKGTYGVFKLDWPQFDYGLGFAFAYGSNTVSTTNYRWRDSNRNDRLDPGEVNLDRNGPDFVATAGATSNVVNPDLKVVTAHEATVSMEQALGSTLSLRGLYVYKRLNGNAGTVNILRPFNVWNRSFSRRDPGPDGALGTGDDGAMITIYDYDPAYRGAGFVANMRQNADPDHSDFYHNLELTMTKRESQRWFGNASLLATKYHVWFDGLQSTPNILLFPLNAVWEVSGRIAGGYEAPLGIRLSTLTQMYSGAPRQRTYQFRAADPAGGPSFPSSSTITLPMEPYGAQRGPKRLLVTMGASKRFRTTRGTFTADVQAFNLLNSNVPWQQGGNQGTGDDAGISDVSGPTYGFVTRIVNPRIIRFGLTYEF